MYDTLILLIVSVILIETSVLLLRRGRPTFRGERAILIDTSVLIDGRLLDIAAAGFAPGRLVIPRSVLGELQLLADGSDHEKRNRARNGLEVITKLQALPAVNMEIYRDQSDAREGVDNRLLALARRLNYELCTVDYNLQKVAEAEGITILSINELSQKLRALYLPGEKLELTLKQKGQEKGQAIGYASDGTMVVVDNADKLLEKTVPVEIIRSLQTNSGKMMFAKLVGQPPVAQQRGDRRGGGGKPQHQARPDTARDAAGSPAGPGAREDRPRKQRFGRSRHQSSKPSPEEELLDLVNNQ